MFMFNLVVLHSVWIFLKKDKQLNLPQSEIYSLKLVEETWRFIKIWQKDAMSVHYVLCTVESKISFLEFEP